MPEYVLKHRQDLVQRCFEEGCAEHAEHRKPIADIFSLMMALNDLNLYRRGRDQRAPEAEAVQIVCEDDKRRYQQQIGINWLCILLLLFFRAYYILFFIFYIYNFALFT